MGTSSPTVGSAGLERVKREADFFMEKTFQVSFGYLGALVALVGASSLDIAPAAAGRLGMSVTTMFCCGALVINAVYLALASGMLFATIKRGVYLVLASDIQDGHYAWEFFLRRSSESPFPVGWLGRLAWNLDNFYMAPLFALIALVSSVVSVVGIGAANGAVDTVAVAMASGLHVLPLAMLVATLRMTRLLEARLEGPG